MKRILRFLGHPAFLSALGTVALAVVVWLVGPLLQIGQFQPLDSVPERIAAVSVLLALWSLRQVLRIWRVRRANRAILDGLVSERPQDMNQAVDSQEEIEELRKRFEEALQVLRTRPMRRRLGRGYLYETPWYILIGPPGSGKTTALRNSGLRFPLADRLGDVKLQGVGGTRNCDWWLTDEAVLLDTAGRYTTQDSYAEADRSAWLGFLDLLRRYRRRRPINGVLIMVGIADLVRRGAAERSAHAQAIRKRLQELHERLGIRFPVYFVFTKCDLVAGFMEHFADLDQEARKQVWGTTLPLEEPRPGRAPVDRFGDEFGLLVDRLEQRIPRRLQEELDTDRRALLFAFPEQFAALKEEVQAFLDEIFQPNRFEIPAQLRGVYFTSGTQEGSPMDRFLSAVAASFQLDRRRLPAFSGQGQSFFITRLLRDVVFREAGLAGANLRLERQTRWLAQAAILLLLAGTASLAGLWGFSYLQNRSYVAKTAQAVEELDQELAAWQGSAVEPLRALPVLDRLRTLATPESRSSSLFYWPGLDQHGKLGAAARRAYDRALYGLLLPGIELRLARQVRALLDDDPDRLYEALRVYLMLHDAEHRDPAAIASWVRYDWRASLPQRTTQAQREALARHLDAALELLARSPHPPLPLDETLVAEARHALSRVPLDQRIYRTVLDSPFTRELEPFDPATAAGPDAAVVFRRPSGKSLNDGVHGLFTVRGYQAFSAQAAALVAGLAGEHWILGRSSAKPDGNGLDRLRQRVRERYTREYIQRWDALIEDIDIVPLSDLAQAREVLRVLTSADSPLRRLLEAIARETMPASRTRALPAGSEGDTSPEAAEQGPRSRISRLFDEATPETVRKQDQRPIEEVDKHFARLHRLVLAPGGGRAPLDRILERLEELYLYLDAIASAADRGEEALRVARQQAQRSDVLKRIKAEADRLPQPIQRWIRTVSSGSATLIGGQVRRRINQAWQGDVLPFCTRAIAGRYPFLAEASLEVTLEDFARFFGPSGLVEQFFDDYLAPFVDTTRHPWRIKTRSGAGALSADALHQLEIAERIRRAFFPGGGTRVEVPFTLTPLDMNPGIRRFLLDLDGQSVEYRHGPPRPFQLTWPGPSPGRVRVLFERADLGEQGETLTGSWAWFRLLERAGLQPAGAPDRFHVRFSLASAGADFLLQAQSVDNPFQLDTLRAFRCPTRL